jgi:cell division protease FtsH
MDTKWLRNSFVYLIILVAIIALFFTVVQPAADQSTAPVSLSEVAQKVKDGQVKSIAASEDKLTIEYIDGSKKTARKETDSHCRSCSRRTASRRPSCKP